MLLDGVFSLMVSESPTRPASGSSVSEQVRAESREKREESREKREERRRERAERREREEGIFSCGGQF